MMTDDEFERVVDAALRSIPDELWQQVDNVEVFVEEQASGQPNLYGLYHGIPLTERVSGMVGQQPDGITIYRRPILRDHGHDRAALQEQIRITVLHEVGHYFGMDEARLRALGYG